MSKVVNGSCYLKTPLKIVFTDSSSALETIPEASVFPKTRSAKVMRKEELEEKHLQAALSQTDSSIPTPDVITIDEEMYESLYKSDQKIPKRRILTIYDDNEASCEYDCDSDDQSWLESWTREHPKTSLSLENFEKSMDFLEKHCKARVPTLEMLTSKKITSRLDAEEVYDYWQAKRLKNGKPLVPQVKRLEKLGNHDPYVAFRPCEEKMKTRKSKAKDKANYLKLLKIRSMLNNDLQNWYAKKNQDIRDHKVLLHKIEEFSAQYQIRNFNDDFLRWTNWPQSEKEVVKVEESKEDDRESSTLGEVEFPFIPQPGSDYLMPIDSNIQDDDFGFYQIVQGGLIRRRVGRGARIIIDRRPGRQNCMTDTFQSVNINPVVRCSKYRFMPQRGNSCSVFKLEDIGRDENIEYNKAEFV